MQTLLGFVGEQPFAERFYLAGGTAVALRLGHRRSIDLDFFSGTERLERPTRSRITSAFRDWNAEAVEDADGNLVLRLPELHVAFLSYGYPLLEEPDVLRAVAIASLLDVGLMKLDAVVGRGSRKDFYDLYFIAHELPVSTLLSRAPEKYPHARDFPLLALEGMTLFDNADRDVEPDLLTPVPWPEVRRFFIDTARELADDWFGLDLR